MIKYSETKKLPHKALNLFDLVLDVESYPEFLPWVSALRILSTAENQIIAEMKVNFKGITTNYTSKITYNRENLTIDVELVEGPFKHLNNHWKFFEEGEFTEVNFEIDFSFSVKFFEKMIGGFFERAAHKMISAFEERAKII